MKNAVHVLGVEYAIVISDRNSNAILREANGYVDSSTKTIWLSEIEQDEYTIKNIEWLSKKVARHEIIHAFFIESGLSHNSLSFDDGWATNEEMVDWLAIQSPKIFEAFREAECL